MHFSSGINRPPYEANDEFLQITSGCSHGRCKFCTFYKDSPFSLSPMEEMQEFIRCLTVPTIFRAEHVTMPVRINGRVPEDKDAMINRLQETMDTNGEEGLQMYRSSVYSL